MKAAESMNAQQFEPGPRPSCSSFVWDKFPEPRGWAMAWWIEDRVPHAQSPSPRAASGQAAD